jgi:hypothetical protein
MSASNPLIGFALFSQYAIDVPMSTGAIAAGKVRGRAPWYQSLNEVM